MIYLHNFIIIAPNDDAYDNVTHMPGGATNKKNSVALLFLRNLSKVLPAQLELLKSEFKWIEKKPCELCKLELIILFLNYKLPVSLRFASSEANSELNILQHEFQGAFPRWNDWN